MKQCKKCLSHTLNIAPETGLCDVCFYRHRLLDLLVVAEAMQEWIDAVPDDAPLPTMPGFDREWAGEVIKKANQSKT